MKHLLVLVACLLLCSCGPLLRADTEPLDAAPGPVATAALYRAAAPGWVDADLCDSLLFTGLVEAVDPTGVDLTAAEDPDEPGRWYRRPVSSPECWAAGESRSTISRDGLLGVMWWAWRHGRLDVLERLWTYGASRNWVMGDDDLGGAHTVLTPAYVGTLARLIGELGGARRLPAEQLPVSWGQGLRGYEAHVQVLHALLRGEAFGHLSEDAVAMLAAHAAREPRNPLFQLAAARWAGGSAAALRAALAAPQLWPPDRLPTAADRCEAWLPQRDTDDGWAPCASGRTHSGADLRFVVGLARRPTR